MASGGLVGSPFLSGRFSTVVAYFIALCCIPLAFVVYWPRLGDFFAFDDFFFLLSVRNHSFWAVMYRSVTFPEQKPFDESTVFWRLLVDLYFFITRPFGIHAQPYHACSFLVHGVVGGLAVVFVWKLTRSVFAGAAAGLLFTIVPTYDFAVSWISQVSELFGAAFILAALLSYRAYLTAESPKPSYAALSVLFSALAFLSKESTAILAILLPALAFAVPPSERRRTRREIVRTLALPVLLAVVFAAAMEIHEQTQAQHLQTLGPHMARNLWRYLKWMVFPYRPGDYLAAREAGAALFLACGVVAVLLRQRALAFFFVWTIVALVPFTGFDEWIELRYTYLATLPFIAFVVCALVTAIERLPRLAIAPGKALLSAAVLAVLIVTPMRTRDAQLWFAGEARGYETMIHSVRNLCGSLPPESHVYVLNAPYRDLYGISTPAAVNLYYHRVYAAPVARVPDLAAFIEHTCVIRYDGQLKHYARIE